MENPFIQIILAEVSFLFVVFIICRLIKKKPADK